MVRIMQSNRIKLLQMLTNFHIGGTERQVANLAMGIDASHFDLHLACLRHSGELLAELETLRVPRSEFRIGRLYSPRTFWQGIRLAHYVRRNLIQIVHSLRLLSECLYHSGRQAGRGVDRRGLDPQHVRPADSHAETPAKNGLPVGRLRPGECRRNPRESGRRGI